MNKIEAYAPYAYTVMSRRENGDALQVDTTYTLDEALESARVTVAELDNDIDEDEIIQVTVWPNGPNELPDYDMDPVWVWNR